SNTIANSKGELKAITTRNGIVLDGPSIPMPHPFINLEEDERVEETLIDPDLTECSIKGLVLELTKATRNEKFPRFSKLLRLTLNMRHDTSSYSNQPQKETINMINIFNDSCEDYLEDLFPTNHLSSNPTFSSHTNLTSPEVKDDIFDPKGGNVLDSTKDLPLPHNINPLSGSTTSSPPDHLLEEFADELALITFPSGK
nr:hypothetical protein [Tanacetum cinerariifolium]